MIDVEQQLSPHFKHKELMCPVTLEVKLQEGFLRELEKKRVRFGLPMHPTSCCRSAEHNKAIGGAKNSFHLMENEEYGLATCAIDIAIPDDLYRHQLMLAGLPDGWSYVIGKDYLHMDLRSRYTALQPIVAVADRGFDKTHIVWHRWAGKDLT